MSEARIRADEILRRMSGRSIGAEIGVAVGQTSEALLRDSRMSLLYMVDSWAAECDQTENYRASGDWHAHCTQAQQDAHYDAAVRSTEFAGDARQIIRKTSVEAAATFKTGFFDFVFIDADHSYEGCKADIEAWKDKVKVGGWLCGHDYGYQPDPDKAWTTGPKKAVDEAVKKYGWNLELGGNYTWFVKMPVTEKIDRKTK